MHIHTGINCPIKTVILKNPPFLFKHIKCNQYSKFFHLIIFGQLDQNNIILKSSYNKLVQNIL